MTDYAKIQVSVIYSPNSDYSSPIVNRVFESEYTPSECVGPIRVSAATGGTTVDLGTLTTPTWALVHNRDATNTVAVAYTSADGAQVDVLQPGDMNVYTDVVAASDIVLTADTAACVCDVIVIGD